MLVAGASGYAGALAAALVWRHPRLELAAATSRGEAGTRLDRLYPRHRVPVELEQLDLERAATYDAALVAYPHGAAAELVGELRGADLPVVDISADFRLHDLSDLRAHLWRPRRPGAPGRGRLRAHGAPPRAIREAKLVANPGCYPTAALLALAPLAEAGLADDVVISAASGVSGAGRGGGERLAFVTVDENFSPYGVEGHRHAPEIVQELGELGSSAPVSFVPHLLPLDQGLLASCYVRLAREVGEEEVRSLYEERYADEPFVELVDEPPGVRDVRDTNLCRVHVSLDAAGRALAFAAIDNLWKGAAGQAIQNLNLMLGFPETEGLAMTFFRSRWVDAPAGVEELDPAELAPGFRAAGVACGLKDGGSTDLGLLACDAEAVGSALLLTRNAAAAAPVRVCREQCDRAGIRAAVVNSGNANAAVGERGYRDALAMRDAAAEALRLDARSVAIAETGPIGVPLAIDAVRRRRRRGGGRPVRARRRGLRAGDHDHRSRPEALHGARRRRHHLRPGQGRRDDRAAASRPCCASSRPTPRCPIPRRPCARRSPTRSSGSPSTAR